MRTLVGHFAARGFVIPALLATALAATDAATRYARLAPLVSSEPPVSFLATPVPLRPFAAADLDGRDVSPATWRGRITLVNVWATWCLPCRDEIPMLVALQQKYRDQVGLVGVLQDRASDASVRAFGACTAVAAMPTDVVHLDELARRRPVSRLRQPRRPLDGVDQQRPERLVVVHPLIMAERDAHDAGGGVAGDPDGRVRLHVPHARGGLGQHLD